MNELFSMNVLLIALTFFLAGGVKGITGMGLPTVVMGVLGVLMSPLRAASLLIIPSFVTNFWQLFTGPDFRALVKRLWLMMLFIVIATVTGSSLLTSAGSEWTSVGLGAALVLYAVHSLFGKPLSVSPATERWLSPIIGLVTGLITGGTGVFVIPAVPYLQSLGMNKDDLIQALGLSFTISTIALTAGLIYGGAFHIGNITLSALAVIPALIGMRVGTMIRDHISPATFRRWFLIFMVVLGLELILRPFF
jgi:uncharacterized protein